MRAKRVTSMAILRKLYLNLGCRKLAQLGCIKKSSNTEEVDSNYLP